MRLIKNLSLVLSIAAMLIVVGCAEDDNEINGTGTLSFEATDAAVDAENVSGVYLSIQEIQVISEGNIEHTFTFDTPETFDLMAYQNGQTRFLGETEIEAGAYDEVRLILNSQSQAWVTFTDGSIEEIDVPSGSTSGYKVKGEFEVLADGFSEVVIDVDLRKALVQEGTGDYKLRPTARLISKTESGVIEGNLDLTAVGDADKVVVYAYKVGTYDPAEAEVPAEGSSRFEGSVNSAVVDATGAFTLAFMPLGDYELIVAKYKENSADNTLAFESATTVEVEIGGEIFSTFSVEANSVTSLFIDLF